MRWRRGWPLAIVLCLLLLGLRSWFYIAWEESFFSSDQAIVGLMAKHLAERRAWPLFFYGQEYQLAVEAWGWQRPSPSCWGHRSRRCD